MFQVIKLCHSHNPNYFEWVARWCFVKSGNFVWFCFYCHNVFSGYCYKLINYHDYISFLAKIKSSDKPETWRMSLQLCRMHSWPKMSDKGHWKICLISFLNERQKLSFRGHVQWSSNNRMFLDGPDFFLN